MSQRDRVLLTLNAGSSSLRLALFGDVEGGAPKALLRAAVSGSGGKGTVGIQVQGPLAAEAGQPPVLDDLDDPREALPGLLGWLGDRWTLAAAGHRVVHGGAHHSGPARITPALVEELGLLQHWAPLHQPHDLAGIRALQAALPRTPQVACFDTAFHHDISPVARQLPLPSQALPPGMRRFGFHGLSYEYIAGQLPARVPGARRVIVAHLGNGASLCALLDGRSVDTTMGVTPLEGLPMGTRSGSVDPGLLLGLISQGMPAEELQDLLYRRAGLLGVSGLSSDMRQLLASTAPSALLAVDLFCTAVARQVAGLGVSLDGLDALVFTGGIGQHAAPVRARVLERCAWLGLRLDPAANARHGPCITQPGSPVSAWVLPTDEESVIAQQTAATLGLSSS
ncbi:MAG: acetate kinase [Chromatiales bacterium]|nr:acetate kinase [Chromatiales bacterium]